MYIIVFINISYICFPCVSFVDTSFGQHEKMLVPAKPRGHLGHRLRPPLVRGPPIVLIYYIMLLSHLGKKRKKKKKKVRPAQKI